MWDRARKLRFAFFVVYSVFLFRFELLHGVGDRSVLCLSDLGVLKIERFDCYGHNPRDQALLTHLWLAGIMCQGAHLVLVALMACSYAIM